MLCPMCGSNPPDGLCRECIDQRIDNECDELNRTWGKRYAVLLDYAKDQLDRRETQERRFDVPVLLLALHSAITTTKHDIYILEHDKSDPAIVSPILEQNKQHLKRLEQAQATLRQSSKE